MTVSENPGEAALTTREREYIRRELDQFFGTFPSVADGFQLRTWRGGPQKGHDFQGGAFATSTCMCSSQVWM